MLILLLSRGFVNHQPPTQVRWDCVYCHGSILAGTEEHYRECEGYIKVRRVEEGEEHGAYNNSSSSSVNITGANNKKRPPETPADNQQQEGSASTSSIRVTPQADSNKKPKPTPSTARVLYSQMMSNRMRFLAPPPQKENADDIGNLVDYCLACKKKCHHEIGIWGTITLGGVLPLSNKWSTISTDEFDPNEAPHGLQNLDDCWSVQKSDSFQSLWIPIRGIVGGLMGPNYFWPRHKYMGSLALDLQLKTWMKKLKSIDPKLVDENWTALRRAVKETLHHRRGVAVEAIRCVFFGKIHLHFFLFFVLFPLELPQHPTNLLHLPKL